MPKRPPSARSNPYLRNRHTVIRLGGPDTSAITGKSQALSRPPTPQAHGSMPASSHEPHTPCGATGPNLRRIDAPLLQQYSQGSQETAFEIAGSEPKRFEAQTSLQNSVYSQTSIKPREARLALWNKLLLQAGVQDPFAITPESVKMGASVLRAAGYRSTMAYVDIAVQEFVRRGGIKSQLLDLTIRDTRRACARGLGSPKHAGAFPMERLPELPDTKPPWSNQGPLWPSRTLQCGCWWLTREIELSNAVVGDITRPEPDTVRWNLPASKSDPHALGMARSHKCACGQLNGGTASVGRAMCPACNLWAQAASARAFAGHIIEHSEYFEDDLVTGEAFPLFPTKAGTFPSKFAMVATIVAAATHLHLDTTCNGKQVWGGHSLRRGGAQYLAKNGVDIWRIQALARHSSSAILLYLDGVHAESLGNIAAEAYLGRDLNNVRDELNALRAQLTRHKHDVEAKLQAALPPKSGNIVIPLTLDEIVPQESTSVKPNAHEINCCSRNPFVTSSRRGGKCHQRNPSTSGRAWCGWEWSLQRGATLVADDKTGLGCTKCALQASAAARATLAASAGAAPPGAAAAAATSSSSSPSPSASGGE